MFKDLKVGHSYSRPELASKWGYSGYQAIARGVVTPAGTKYLILFVTEEKQDSSRAYHDKLEGNLLSWEGPDDHFAERRMLATSKTSDEIHVFYRKRHHSDFQYLGQAKVIESQLNTTEPSRFVLAL